MSITIAEADRAVRAAGCKCSAQHRELNYLHVCEPKRLVRCGSCGLRGSWAPHADKPSSDDRVSSQAPVDWKSHFLIGLHSSGGSAILARWPHAPQKKDIDAVIAPLSGYLQFTVVNPTGIITVETTERKPCMK